MTGAQIAVIMVAVISGVASVASSIISSRSTTNAVTHQLDTGQKLTAERLEFYKAATDEKIDTYQKQTNEKIDRLTSVVDNQATYGTRLTLLEEWKRRCEDK